MAAWKWLLGVFVLFVAVGCSHGDAVTSRGDTRWRGASPAASYAEPREGARLECGTLPARIWALIGQGQFAEAEVLIAEGAAAGLLSKPAANRMLEEISKLTTRLGQLPARLHRVPDFPSQLKEHTLYEIEQMLASGDFKLATKAQLLMAQKLIRQQPRLMQKL
jgi:hypothetical protein